MIKIIYMIRSGFLQVISVAPGDSKVIQDCGADRIQLVSALEIGGLTPSKATIRRSLEIASLPHHVIIRPHNNGFVFTAQQKQLMLEDIIEAKNMNAHGVVIGGLIEHIQNQKKQMIPDYKFVQEIIKEVGGKINVVFHKASDQLSLYNHHIEGLFNEGVSVILTQGGQKPLLENIDILEQLKNDNWSKILLGGGISHSNKAQIMSKLNPTQIHIGTCVRQNRYGPVSHGKLKQFMQL